MLMGRGSVATRARSACALGALAVSFCLACADSTARSSVVPPSGQEAKYVFLLRRSDLVGGKPARIESFRLAQEGEWQYVDADSSDRVSRLAEGNHVHTELWKQVATLAVANLPPSVSAKSDPTVVAEFHSSRLWLVIGLHSGSFRKHDWPVSSLPPEIQALWQRLTMELLAVPPGRTSAESYLRADALLPEESADLPTPVEFQTGKASTLLKVLDSPGLTLPVPTGENPFSPYRAAFQPGRDVLEIRRSGVTYQIRSFLRTP